MPKPQKFIPKADPVVAYQFGSVELSVITDWLAEYGYSAEHRFVEEDFERLLIKKEGAFRQWFVEIGCWICIEPQYGYLEVLSHGEFDAKFKEDDTNAQTVVLDLPVKVNSGHFVLPLDNPTHIHAWGEWEHGGPKDKFFVPMDRWYRKCINCTEQQMLEIFEEGK